LNISCAYFPHLAFLRLRPVRRNSPVFEGSHGGTTLQSRTADEAARRLDLRGGSTRWRRARTTIYEAIQCGALKSLKIGKRRLIRIDALEQWLKAQEALS
jgi:excisionase family DNA binding protein